MTKYKIFVNGVNVYDGVDQQRQVEVLEICQKLFRVTGATAKVEVYNGETLTEHQYIGGSLFSQDSLGVSVVDHTGVKDRVM